MKKHIPISIIFIVFLFLWQCSDNETKPKSGGNDTISVSTLTDIDGNIYKTVKIGNQWWMAENLKVTKDADGNSIFSYIYDNDDSNEVIFGRLYTWTDMMNGASIESAQGIAPEGWHIPSDEEWMELFDYLGGLDAAGSKMKSSEMNLWNDGQDNITNSSQFSGLPAGGGIIGGDYQGIGDGTHYWSSTSHGDMVMAPTLHNEPSVLLPQIPKNMKVSIRCIKN